MPTYQHSQSSGLPPSTPSQNQYNYQSRSYYATSQSQPITTKPTSNYLLSPSSQVGSQQMYYKQCSASQIASIPMKQNNYLENRSTEANTQNNGQYQTSTSNEQTYRATHNLPPIAALSNYRPNKSSKDYAKTSLPRAKVPSSNSYPTSVGQPLTHPAAIQHTKPRSESYSHTSSANYNVYTNTLNQNQRISQQVPTVITQSYTNVIMTTANTSHYSTPSNQNHSTSVVYQTTKPEMQNVPRSQPIQNINYLKPKTVDNRTDSVLNVMNTSVIKQRKESPLDLSVKTVRTSADSTEGEAARCKYGQNKSHSVISSHNYPTLDVNSIERSFTQRSQLPTATAPKVEFHPNFNLSSRHSNWNHSKSSEDSVTKRNFQEPSVHGGIDYNKHMTYPPESLKSHYPPSSVPNIPQYIPKSTTQNLNDFNGSTQNVSQMYPYDRSELTTKRPGEVESPVIPNKIAKVENWRESINLQIEEKFTSHYKQQQLQAQQHHHTQIHHQHAQTMPQQHKSIDETSTSALMNGNHSQANVNNMYNYQKQAYTPVVQQNQPTYNKVNNSYPVPKQSQSYVPSSVNHHYSGYYNTSTKQSQHLYINPAARHNSNSPLAAIAKPNIATGADKRVLSLLRNSIEIKEQKKIEQQKSLDIAINQRTDIQHPNTDVTAPLQPKPGIDRNNVSPFTPISVPDPNICKMPPKIVAAIEQIHTAQEIGVINKAPHEENTVIRNHTSNDDYDGLAAFLAASRIRTKGELKEVTHNANNNAARDARIQAFLEDTIKSPNRQNMHISSSSSVSSANATPPKLLKERQGAFAPRKRLFSRNDDDPGKHEVPMREKTGLRSSSETSVFDFPDSDDENEMPVLERQTLDAMRKDRRNSLKQSTTPLHNLEAEAKIEILETPSRAPSPEDDIFGSICDNFMEQLKNKSTRRIKRIIEPELEVKLEPTKDTNTKDSNTISENTDVKVKIETVDDEFLLSQPEQNKTPDKTNHSTEVTDKLENIAENCKTPITENIRKSVSDMSDSEIKSGEHLAARNKHRVRRKIMPSSDSSDIEEEKLVVKIEKIEVSNVEQKCSEPVEIKIEDPNTNEESNKTQVVIIKPEEIEKDKESETVISTLEVPQKPPDLLAIIRPAKKPSFGDGSDFYPGWEEGVYKYKKSLRMPPSLIQLTRPPMRLSTSLPDLDPCPQSPTTSFTTDAETKDSLIDNKKSLKKFKSEPVDSDSESTSSFNVFCKKTNYDSEGSSSIKSLPNTKKENMSILDRLLEKCGGRKKRKHKRKDDHSPKVVSKSENSVELLATPTPSLAATKSPEKSKGLISPVINATSAVLPFRKDTVNNFKETFINCGNNLLAVHDKFTTIVLSSRTRKETRAMKQRATIKEVFGEDRPASAPPVTCVNDLQSKKEIHKLEPFSKTLEELLIKKEKLDENKEIITTQETTTNASENDKDNAQPTNTFSKELMATNIKKEMLEDDDDENKKLIDLIVKKDPDACSETMSLDGEETGIGGKRKNKYGKIRRKFSSGFDYIRKKKKIKKEETDNGSVERKKKKGLPGKAPESIDDIQKEIKSWVLNKGIGESHLHRAARLGYVVSTIKH